MVTSFVRLLFLCSIVLLAACEEPAACCDPVPACNTTDPVNDLLWLKHKIAEKEKGDPAVQQYFFIEQATLNGETVFIFNNCCPNCMALVPVYNCLGELVCEDLPTCPAIAESLDGRILLWHPANFNCSFSK